MAWSVNDLNTLIRYFEDEYSKLYVISAEKHAERIINAAFKKYNFKHQIIHSERRYGTFIVTTEPVDGKYAICFIKAKGIDNDDQHWINRGFKKVVDEYTGKLNNRSNTGIFKRFLNKLHKGTDVTRYYDGNWIKVVILTTQNESKDNMKKTQLREIIRQVIREERISKGFAKAAESYQKETLELQKLQSEQQKLVQKFKSSSSDDKETLKSELIKMHRRVKSQQDKVDIAEKLFSRAIMMEPVDYDE